jgi:aminoglycoside 3-N-acetyltransferase I
MRAKLALFGEVCGEPDTYCARAPGDAWLRQVLSGENFIALAAVAGPMVLGGITAYQLLKPEQERSEIYIYDLAVAEAHRRRGVATALIAAVRRIAAARGAWVVYVQADRGDEPAIRLYSRPGTREDVLHFDIRVVADGA